MMFQKHASIQQQHQQQKQQNGVEKRKFPLSGTHYESTATLDAQEEKEICRIILTSILSYHQT
jgi:hypothetical protein